MSIALRLLLVFVSVLTIIWILYKIRKFKVKMEHAIYWVGFSALLLVLAVFPQIPVMISRFLGIESPSNFIFLAVICLLLFKVFTLSVTVSLLEDKVQTISAELAIRSQDLDKRVNLIEEAKKTDTNNLD